MKWRTLWKNLDLKYLEMLMMTERNLTKELLYSYYVDMKNGDDVESIDYRSLIHILTELMNRIEQLEKDNEILKSYALEQ
jgi:hypothetical protein